MAGGSDACGQGLQHSGLTASGRPRTGGSSQASPASPERARQGCGPGAPGSAVPGEPGGRKGAPFPLSHGLPEEDQRSARLPGCQARSIKAAGAREEKGQCASAKLKSPSPGAALAREGRGRGDRAVTGRAVRLGVPRRDKRASVLSGDSPGAWGSIKGSCVPAALKFTFVFGVQVKGRLQKSPQALLPRQGSGRQEWPSSFSKMLGTRMKIELCLPACWDSGQRVYP